MEDGRGQKCSESGLEIFGHPGHISLGTQRLVEFGVGHVSLGNEVIPSEPKIGGPTPID